MPKSINQNATLKFVPLRFRVSCLKTINTFVVGFLQLFKMEDVSMGMWVEQFNSSTPVQYSHNWKFCQYGCMENYYTAHYQSPRQMICLWDNLARGRAHCCNFRWHTDLTRKSWFRIFLCYRFIMSHMVGSWDGCSDLAIVFFLKDKNSDVALSLILPTL